MIFTTSWVCTDARDDAQYALHISFHNLLIIHINRESYVDPLKFSTIRYFTQEGANANSFLEISYSVSSPMYIYMLNNPYCRWKQENWFQSVNSQPILFLKKGVAFLLSSIKLILLEQSHPSSILDLISVLLTGPVQVCYRPAYEVYLT